MALPQVYGREQEKARLQRMGGTEPTHIALFTGPPNSGKTALLKDYCEGRQYQGVCYMDCWQEDTTTPTGDC
jgi:Ni2+-binding GTPase involved in maturation of urease and hydrogenase